MFLTPLLNTHSHAMLADGARFYILYFVHDRCRKQNHCVRVIGPDIDVGDAG